MSVCLSFIYLFIYLSGYLYDLCFLPYSRIVHLCFPASITVKRNSAKPKGKPAPSVTFRPQLTETQLLDHRVTLQSVLNSLTTEAKSFLSNKCEIQKHTCHKLQVRYVFISQRKVNVFGINVHVG